MLIVIEGLDGSGKSTQVRKVREYLTSVGRTPKYIHFPRYNAPLYGDLISRFLRGEFGSIDAVHPTLVALLFAEDRKAASSLVKRWLRNGETVLFDRYVYSNIAYQCAKLKDKEEADRLRQWIFNTEYNQFGVPVPDLNIFLDVPVSFVDANIHSERKGHGRDYLNGQKDIHEADISFQMKVRDIYLEQTEADKNFIRVDCSDRDGNMLSPDDAFSRLKTTIDAHLK